VLRNDRRADSSGGVAPEILLFSFSLLGFKPMAFEFADCGTPAN
jgi:hypothetical protein